MLKAVFTDLDGTLTIEKNIVGNTNLKTLEKLGEQRIVRVIATGRSYFSAKKVLPENFPIDYLIFSSGAGIINWKTKELIFEQNIYGEQISLTQEILIDEKVDFMLHKKVPENHHFYYWTSGRENPDFENRIKLYKDFAEPLNNERLDFAAQFIAIINNHALDEFVRLKNRIDFLHIIKTTSPLDDKTIWMEFFPKGVSKGHSSEWLVRLLGMSSDEVLAIGNDYNDHDLLEWGGMPMLVGNAPDEMLDKYKSCKPNHENGFTSIVQRFFKVGKKY